MFSKAEIEIILEGPDIYRPNDQVKGIIVVKAKKDFEIKALQIDFSGVLNTTFVDRIEVLDTSNVENNQPPQTRIKHISREDVHNLFTKTLSLLSTLSVESLKKGQEKVYNFEFTFPQYVTCQSCKKITNIPPSIPQVGDGVYGIYSQYYLKACLSPNSVVGSSSARVSLKFKPYGNSKMEQAIDQDMLSFKKSLQWKSKLKKYVDDNYHTYGDDVFDNEEKYAKKIIAANAIPNPIDSSHRHTRHFRQYFDKNYKYENYKKLVGDVNFEVELSLPCKIICATEDIGGTMNLILRCKVEKLQPDFLLFCNKSSQLGCFVINHFKLSVIREMSVTAQGNRGKITQTHTILERNFGYELAFDIIDFIPNFEDPTIKEWNLPMNKIFGDEIVSLISTEIGPDYISECGVLSSSHVFQLELSIAPNLDKSCKTAKFEYQVCLI